MAQSSLAASSFVPAGGTAHSTWTSAETAGPPHTLATSCSALPCHKGCRIRVVQPSPSHGRFSPPRQPWLPWIQEQTTGTTKRRLVGQSMQQEAPERSATSAVLCCDRPDRCVACGDLSSTHPIYAMIRSSKNWRAVGFVRTAPHESRSLPARLPARQERGSTQASTTPAWPCLGVQRQEGRRPCAGPARFAQAKRRRTNQPSRRRCRGCAAGRGETVVASRLPWTRNQRERIARVFKVGVCDGPPRPVGRRAWELTCTWCGTAVVVRVRPRIPEDLRSAKKYRIEYKDCVSITNNEEVAISKCVAGCAGQVMRTGSHTALCARADPSTSHAPFSSTQCCHPTQHSKKRTLQPRERS